MLAHLRCSESCPYRCHRFGAETCCQGCPPKVAELCRKFRLCRQGECLCSDADTLLMAAFVDGDELAFNALYNRNYEWVWQMAYQILQHREEAHDIAQEVFLRVIAFRNRWQATARFRTWLHQIVANTCLKRKRSIKQREEISLDDWLGSSDDLTESLSQALEASGSEVKGRLKEAIASLPNRQRQAVELLLQGYSIEQIAQTMNCSRPAVDALLHRARKNLKMTMC